eukprot:TRINITY_DN6479_c0_g1_i3.p1 TRINITY_DN6479_c0_g1~~TRINITY_DN6479_c0_g1_i3.p1  ORF type:complete len:118 (+),score=9.06 TRINITY_DN6479_c0_g1_i3:242-595(+)
MSIPPGSKVSIISKNIRYEGTVSNVDSDQRTLKLESVRVHGTEDRVPFGHPGYESPKDEVYSYIIFRCSEIQLVSVLSPQESHPPDTQSIYMNNPYHTGYGSPFYPYYPPYSYGTLN